jgi:SAM-dependent methyltransferase
VREHLPFVSVRRNQVAPPLPYPDASMDLVYAFSVLTHLPADMQGAWLWDLYRVLRPRGRLLVSTHGEAYAETLTRDERAAFEAGELVSRFEGLPGSNLCGTYHPPVAMRRLARECGFEVRRFRASGARANGRQDLWLLARASR